MGEAKRDQSVATKMSQRNWITSHEGRLAARDSSAFFATQSSDIGHNPHHTRGRETSDNSLPFIWWARCLYPVTADVVNEERRKPDMFRTLFHVWLLYCRSLTKPIHNLSAYCSTNGFIKRVPLNLNRRLTFLAFQRLQQFRKVIRIRAELFKTTTWFNRSVTGRQIDPAAD